MNRKVQQCKICKEWFNTTDEIMLKHRLIKHNIASITIKIDASKVIESAERCIKAFEEFGKAMSKVRIFPLN